MATNWSINGQAPGAGGAPQNGDNLQFGGTAGGVNGALTASTDDMNGLAIGNLMVNNNFNATATLDNSLTVNGNVNITKGTPSAATIAGDAALNVPNATSSFNWGGGTISAPLNFGQAGKGGTMTINGSDIAINNAFTNNGTVNWTSQNPQQGPGPNINIGGGGSITNRGTLNINTSSTETISGTGTIQNNGKITKTGVNTTTVQIGAFTNALAGTLTLNSGLLSFTKGTLVSNTTGSLVFNGGNLSDDNTFTISGGTVQGVGILTAPTVSQSGGTITLGLNGVPGKLTIQGNYSQTGSAAGLVINVDSARNVGDLSVEGIATLAGTLTVNNNGFTGSSGGFSFLQSNSLTGDFSSQTINGNYWQDPNNGESLDYFVTRKDSMSYWLVVQQML